VCTFKPTLPKKKRGEDDDEEEEDEDEEEGAKDRRAVEAFMSRYQVPPFVLRAYLRLPSRRSHLPTQEDWEKRLAEMPERYMSFERLKLRLGELGHAHLLARLEQMEEKHGRK